MKFLVYTVEPKTPDTTLGGFNIGADQDIAPIIRVLEQMTLSRVLENKTVSAWIKDLDYDEDSGTVTAKIYRQTSPGKALHQAVEGEGEPTVEEILAENEDAFIQGYLGIRKVGGEIYLLIEKGFGSFFQRSAKGIKVRSEYSSKTIESIKNSASIGRTTLDFAPDFDLTKSVFKTPEDEDIREEEGFGVTDIPNKIVSLVNLSSSDRISLDIDRDTWLDNVEIFNDLIEAGVVTKIRIEGTTDNIVTLGEDGDRAIRKSVTASRDDDLVVEEAFLNFSP